MAKKKNRNKKVETFYLDTTMTNNQFYAEFGSNMLYVTGIYLEKFYRHTNDLLGLNKKWSKKDKRELKFIIKAFKLCGDSAYRDREQHKKYLRQVDKAIRLYKKHWFFLWN